MKLYLSSYRIPTPDDLSKLLGKPLDKASMALIPNAQDYYSKRAKAFKVKALKTEFEARGFKVTVVDLQDYDSADEVKRKLALFDLIWAMGGNTFCLRYEMQRSGFDKVIQELLADGIVYAGDSAGALVAGVSITGIESADEPAYAEAVIDEGLNLVPYVILPHVDNPTFIKAVETVRKARSAQKDLIELKDSQAVIFDGTKHCLAEAALKTRFVFIHGNQTTHWSSAWAAWLKDELEQAGYDTFFETMPDSIIAREEYWLPFLEEHVQAGVNDVLIGWSSGATAAMRYAETHKVKGSVLVSPCYTDLDDDLEKQSGYYDKPWQWVKIRNNQDNIALVWGDDDPYIPQEEFTFIAERLDPLQITVSDGKHFIERTEFPELLQYIKDVYE